MIHIKQLCCALFMVMRLIILLLGSSINSEHGNVVLRITFGPVEGAQGEQWRKLTHLLTPWCRVLEKLTGLQLVKKIPAFHGTRRFITALTSVRHL